MNPSSHIADATSAPAHRADPQTTSPVLRTPAPAPRARHANAPGARTTRRWRGPAWALGLVGLGLLLPPPPALQAQETVVVPELLNYQGVLETLDGTGTYTNGLYDVEFRIWSAATSGTLLWGQKYSVYVSNGGYFNVVLGEGGTTLTNATSFNNLRDVFRTASGQTGRYLGLTVRQDEKHANISSPVECTPRQQLLTGAFAFQAQYAQYANQATNKFYADKGLAVSGDVLSASAGLTSTKGLTVSGAVATVQNGLTVSGTTTLNNGLTVSGATATLNAGLDVSGTTYLRGTVSNACTTLNGGFVPVGGIIMWSGATNSLPDGWALCNGQTVNNQVTPDLRDRFIVSSGSTYAVKATGGANSFTLSMSNIPSHTHAYKDGFFAEATASHTMAPNGGYDTSTAAHVGSHDTDDDNKYIFHRPMTTDAAGQTAPTALENRPAYYALAFIMRVR